MKRALAIGVIAAGAAAVYQRYLRRPILDWGSTPAEAAGRLPGDDLLDPADGVATRAITIDAPPEAIWPWIVQMGPAPRGGIYTYDWIENLLGLNMHSADEILEQFQNPQIGDRIGLGENPMEIAVIEPNHALVWRAAHGNWVWAFVLEPQSDGTTRLISRNRFKLPRLVDRLGMIPMEPGSLVMERKMLQGFKERGERLARARPAE